MSDLVQKVILALVTALVSGTISGAAVYATKAVQLEGRVSGIEQSLVRIEARLYEPVPTRQLPPKEDRR